jgi:peptidoglycan biosynthesis protein MviN/MurJ (putative lipid II flippase)
VTSPRDDQIRAQRGPNEPASVGEVVNLVKAYAKQETVGPLKNTGRWMAMGTAGALALAIGGVLLLLGLLRLLQTEWERSARGSLSWLPYVIVLVVAAAAIALAVSRIKKDSLDKTRK